jgi:hypothetical protein
VFTLALAATCIAGKFLSTP